nr:hypothetical protein [Tanacetum cinerariifolium]
MVMVSMIAQEEEAGIQSTQEEFEFMAAADAYEETKRVKANCILENNLQQASTSGTQSDKALVYDSDGSAEVHLSENCYDNDIFNMFTQEEQYTELLEPILEPHQVPQNDSNVIFEVFSVEQGGGTVEQHPLNIEETRVLYDSLYNNLAIEVEKVNSGCYRYQVVQNVVQNLGIQIVENMNGLSVVSEIANQYGNRIVVTTPTEGNGNGINGNSIRCYNCRRLGHYASIYTIKPRKRDAAYLQQQLQIAQEEEAGIQSTQEEFEFMATADAYEKTERVKANCILENIMQQALTSGTQSDKALVYDSDGSAEVHLSENCYENDIFNMFTQEEQYTKLLEPIPEPHQVPQNDSNVISEVFSVEQGGGTVEQHPSNIEETRVLYNSLYNNLAIEVEKVNSVNRKLRETNTDL